MSLTHLTRDARLHACENQQKEQAMHELQRAVRLCVEAGFVPTIETMALPPLAMRNYVLVIDAREVR